MKKSLQILFGFMLILVLSYVSFLDVASKVKDDLLLKTKTMFSEKNVRGVSVELKGEGLRMSRTLVLTGTAISEVEIERISTLSENIEGVCSIDNQLKIRPIVPKVPLVPRVIEVPLVKILVKPVVSKSTSTEIVPTTYTDEKITDEKVVENQLSKTSVPIQKETIKVPTVPTVESNSVIVPTPVQAIHAPKVIKVEEIKLEGVK